MPPSHEAITRRTLLQAGALSVGIGRGLQQPAPYSSTTAINSALEAVRSEADLGPYSPSWPGITGQFGVPQWYKDAKFGIFIHWGAYSVPAFGSEWYPRMMYIQGSPEYRHHIATYGPQTRFGYKDFIPMFRAARFDAAGWAALFRQAGARFVVPVAEHHDGFAMWNSAITPWCAGKMGPKRDVIGELAAAVRADGMTFGVSFHRAEHWWFFNGGRTFPSDVQDARWRGLYGPAAPDNVQPNARFLDEWLARAGELVNRYNPQLFWFDWWIEQPAFQTRLQQFAACLYNRGIHNRMPAAINYKGTTFPGRAAVLDLERGQLAQIRPTLWQTDTSVSTISWGYIQNDRYKLAGDIIQDLVDIVSKNGVLLLNIGPKSDGTIAAGESAVLVEIGKWLAVNGEAIYATRPWIIFGEGPSNVVGGSFNDTKRTAFTGSDIRFTQKGGRLYAIIMAWPGSSVTVTSLSSKMALAPAPVATVRMLGCPEPLAWTQDDRGLTVQMPGQRPCDTAYSLEITFRTA
ncbi:MAG: alpha-L-fucosidase [Armatimonadetes bacterium]|nr:alpha-L-fucosidase [Armatimonadota bacterium]MDE2206471.1 alpha-L-fucosidase [Armatimonadota bacterium]